MDNLSVALINALGDADAMDKLMHDDVALYLPRSAGDLTGPHLGRAAVYHYNEITFNERFYPDVKSQILDTLHSGDLSVSRFLFQARFRASGLTYHGEYAFFVRSKNGLILEIVEMLDTLDIAEFLGIAKRTDKVFK